MVPGTRPTQTLKQNATSYLSALASRNHRCVKRLWPFNHRRNKTQSVTHAMVYKNLAVKPALFCFRPRFESDNALPLWRNTYLRITRRIPTRAGVCVYVYMYTQYVALMYFLFMCIHTVGLHTCKLTHICMWGIGTANIWFEDAF